ncbi:MAG TPA: S-layer protein [Cyanophyceae cyanobacterium]
MKLQLLTPVALLAATFAIPVQAQDTPSVVIPATQSEVSDEYILQSCSQNQANTLPNPFSDVSPNHGAFNAVMSIHYCGAYRGTIPPEQAKPLLETPIPQPVSKPATEWDWHYK